MSLPRFEGIPVQIGGTEFVVPPLTLGQLRRLRPALDAVSAIVSGDLTNEQIDQVAEVVHAALSRNHPEISKESLLDLLDLGNMGVIFQAVMGVSGLKKALAATIPTP